MRTVLLRVAVVVMVAVLAFACALAAVAFRHVRAGAKGVAATPLAAPERVALANGWVAHRVELEPQTVDLDHLGMHTHANWVLFELPFDPSARGVRRVSLRPYATRETNVAAVRTPLGCLPAPGPGSIEGRGWAEYTASGTDGTRLLSEHPLSPTMSGRVFAVNVPTRVANAAACWDEHLRTPAAWRLEVSWEALD